MIWVWCWEDTPVSDGLERLFSVLDGILRGRVGDGSLFGGLDSHALIVWTMRPVFGVVPFFFFLCLVMKGAEVYA